MIICYIVVQSNYCNVINLGKRKEKTKIKNYYLLQKKIYMCVCAHIKANTRFRRRRRENMCLQSSLLRRCRRWKSAFTWWCCRFPELSVALRPATARRPPAHWRRSPVQSGPSTTVWPCCQGPINTNSLAVIDASAELRLWPPSFLPLVCPWDFRRRCPITNIRTVKNTKLMGNKDTTAELHKHNTGNHVVYICPMISKHAITTILDVYFYRKTVKWR